MSEPPLQRRLRGLTDPPAGVEPRAVPPANPPTPGLLKPPAAPAPKPRPKDDDGDAPRTVQDVDDAIDAELARSTGRPGASAIDTNFKRKKDDDVEAELEALMAGFDPESLRQAPAGRTRAADREGQPKAGIGQEDRPGIQRGKVVALRGDTVFLDLGAKSEGVVPLDQFKDAPPAVGDIVEVVFDRYDKDEGLLVMSRQGAAVAATWANLKKGMIVEARVTKAIKGGAEVDVNGIRGFLPISQIEMAHVESVADYLNQKLRCLVTEVSVRDKNLVVSRRDLLEKERAEQREKTWATLEEGQTRTGVVRNIKPFGAFVDIGGVDGLVPVGEMSWGRVADPSQVVKLGQEVEVQVLRVDKDAQKVTLGMKQLQSSPWDTIWTRYHVGSTVPGTVTKIMEFGAFVELEPGIEGLIHISEMGPKKVYRIKDFVEPGKQVDVRILSIDDEARRIALSLRPPAPTAKPEVEDDEEFDDTPRPPKPEPKVPLKGGLGDRDPNPFGKPPK
jgi:small subunit ribosomal protein S1